MWGPQGQFARNPTPDSLGLDHRKGLASGAGVGSRAGFLEEEGWLEKGFLEVSCPCLPSTKLRWPVTPSTLSSLGEGALGANTT